MGERWREVDGGREMEGGRQREDDCEETFKYAVNISEPGGSCYKHDCYS